MRTVIRLVAIVLVFSWAALPSPAIAAKREKAPNAFSLDVQVSWSCPTPDYCEPAGGSLTAHGAIVQAGLLPAAGWATLTDWGLTLESLQGDFAYVMFHEDSSFDLWIFSMETGSVPVATGTAAFRTGSRHGLQWRWHLEGTLTGG